MGPVDPTATGGTIVTGQEGLTQDTFVLTLDGLAAAYAGQVHRGHHQLDRAGERL